MSELSQMLAGFMEEQATMLQWQAAKLRNFVPPVAPAPVVAAAASAPLNKKEKKDPNKPKRAPSAYQLYMSDNQGPIKKKFPELPQTQIMSRVAVMWSGVPADVKKKYQDKSDKLRVIQQANMKAYKEGSSNGASAGASSSSEVVAAPAPASAQKAKTPSKKATTPAPAPATTATTTSTTAAVAAATSPTPTPAAGEKRKADTEQKKEKKEKKHKKDKKESA